MKSIRFYLALYGAKLFSKALVMLHRNGTHNPGVLAMKICPDFLTQMDKPKTIIGITGTNGKTTTANMVNDILIENGFDPVSNRTGSNILGGIATTLINTLNWKGQVVKDLVVLELDERSSRLIYPHVHPTLLLVTNLFRDSFKRNAHSEFIFDILDQHIPASTKLVLNGDDLVSARLAPNNDRVYFGIEPLEHEDMTSANIIQDMPLCPYCGAPMQYEFRRYHHIGRAHCTRCDFGSPELNYAVTSIKDGRLQMRIGDQVTDLKMVGSSHDAYNLASAVALLSEFGLTPIQLRASIEKLQILKSRYIDQVIGGKRVISTLAKGQNPVACSRVFDTIRQTPGRKAVVLMIDDLGDAETTSENIAWLYDTDFEFLVDDSIIQIICSGLRRLDHQVRLLVGGADPSRITCIPEEADAVNAIRLDDVDTIFLLHDVYTAYKARTADTILRARLEEKEEA
ncbi:MAG: DUF1727 domain-containing protein [Firmicutes bacterium]|nr:DUF1727 domain-containing protein [Bacillota bacterium]